MERFVLVHQGWWWMGLVGFVFLMGLLSCGLPLTLYFGLSFYASNLFIFRFSSLHHAENWESLDQELFLSPTTIFLCIFHVSYIILLYYFHYTTCFTLDIDLKSHVIFSSITKSKGLKASSLGQKFDAMTHESLLMLLSAYHYPLLYIISYYIYS